MPRIPLSLPGRGPQSEAFHGRRPVIINNLRERRGQVTGKTLAALEPEALPQSSLYVPLLVQGKVVGVVQVQSDTPNRFSQADAEVLMLIGNTAAAAIDNAHLFQTTRRQLDELSLVSRVALATASREPFDQAVAQATEALKQLWPRTSALGFLFMDPAAPELRLHPSYQGMSADTALPLPLHQGLVGASAAAGARGEGIGRPALCADDDRDAFPDGGAAGGGR